MPVYNTCTNQRCLTGSINQTIYNLCAENGVFCLTSFFGCKQKSKPFESLVVMN